MSHPIPRKLAKAVWAGGTWAVVDLVSGRGSRTERLAQLDSVEARIAAIAFRALLDAGMLVLVDTSPEIIALKLAVGLAAGLWAVYARRAAHAQPPVAVVPVAVPIARAA